MAIFGQLLGAGISLLGNKLGGSSDRRASQAALAEMESSRRYIPPELESGLFRAAKVARGALDTAVEFNKGGIEAMTNRELERLQAMRQPMIDRSRAQLQSRLLARGRLGVGVGGGRTGGLFNPETAALEEAILGAQLGDIGAARTMATNEANRLLNSSMGLFRTAYPLIDPGRQVAPGFAAMPFANQASSTRGFFGGLAQGLGGMDFGGVFGGSGFNLPANGLGAGNPGR